MPMTTTPDHPDQPRPITDPLKTFIEAHSVQNFILFVIIINAIVLGLQTSRTISVETRAMLGWIDSIALWIFVIELLIKMFVYRWSFVKDGWNVFDFIIVGIALVPNLGAGFSVLRALRIMRALRVMTIVPSMRSVVGALLSALPGMTSVVIVLVLVFYIAAVMATQLFGRQTLDSEAYIEKNPEIVQLIEEYPEVLLIQDEWFGSVGQSLYSLFQIMTLESWSMGIVRPTMKVYPWAWAFFVPFIVLTSFMVLNLFIALIVNSLDAMQEQEEEETEGTLEDRIEDVVEGGQKGIEDDLTTIARRLVSIESQLGEFRKAQISEASADEETTD